MAKTRVCEGLFMRRGCGRQFRAGWFSRARQCPSCTSAFLTPVDYVDQSGPVRTYDLGLYGRRSSVLAGGQFSDCGLWRGLNGNPRLHVLAYVDPVADEVLAADLGRRVGMFMPTLQPSGRVIDGDTAGGGHMFERPAING